VAYASLHASLPFFVSHDKAKILLFKTLSYHVSQMQTRPKMHVSAITITQNQAKRNPKKTLKAAKFIRKELSRPSTEKQNPSHDQECKEGGGILSGLCTTAQKGRLSILTLLF
jgi:hypothetical protein